MKHEMFDQSMNNGVNERIIFNPQIAQKTADFIVNSGAYSINFDKPKDEWIKLPDGSIIPCYCNCRFINSDPIATQEIGKYMSQMIKEKLPETELVIGLATAGISWASRIALEQKIPMAYVRSNSKGYGMGNLIECNPPKKLKTVIIDDAFFSGGSIEKAIDAIRSEIDADIIGVGVITNLSNLKQNIFFKNQLSQNNIPLISLTDYSFILNNLKEKELINETQLLQLKQYYNNPESHPWG